MTQPFTPGRHADAATRTTHRGRVAQIALCAAVALAAGTAPAQAVVTKHVHSGNSAVGTTDPLVRILADSASGNSNQRPADVIAKHMFWGIPLADSQWVSNSPQGASSGQIGWTRYAITLPQIPFTATNAKLTGDFYTDDIGTAYVNTGQVGKTASNSVWKFAGTPTPFATAAGQASQLQPGATNTLRFDIGNVGGGANGLDFEGNLTYDEGPPGPIELDHFKCYTVKPTSPPTRAVGLKDQFGNKKSSVREVRELCNPVEKVHGKKTTKRRHPSAHLVCRRTVDQGTIPQRAVRLQNQFGTVDTVTTGSQTLCLPSLKRKLRGKKTPTPTGKNPEKVLDHFRCYGVQQRNVPVAVKLTDQFGKGAASVMRLVKLCNPVQKTFKNKVTKIKYPKAHLACYTIKDGMKFKPLDVAVLNQFGKRRLRVQKAQLLCVPTFKQLLPMNNVPAERLPGLPPTPVVEPFVVGLSTTACTDGTGIVHTVKVTTSPGHPFGTATGVLTGGGQTFPAQTVTADADGTWTAQMRTPLAPATYRWDWTVMDIGDATASASIAVIVQEDNPRC